jgi:hypothetical protein
VARRVLGALESETMIRRDHFCISAIIASAAALALVACASNPGVHGVGGASSASSSTGAIGTGGAAVGGAGASSSSESSATVGTSGGGAGGAPSSSTLSSSASSTSTTGSGCANGGGGSGVTILSFQKFDSPTLPSDWSIGAQSGGAVSISTDTTVNYGQSVGSIRGSFPASQPGGVFVWAVYDMSAHKSRDVGIRLRAKMPGSKQGLKFVKVFGGNAGGAYANTTFGLDYTGIDPGCMYAVSFGDGSVTSNDTQNVILFDGTNPTWIGRSYGTAMVQTPQGHLWASSSWGTGWHLFELYVRFNSGDSPQTEVADGAYIVKIDGVTYVCATGIFNRHYSDPPIDNIQLFGWEQNSSQPFEVWYDNVEIAIGGFGNSPV